jgi:hydroxyacylglutathione hydrolase
MNYMTWPPIFACGCLLMLAQALAVSANDSPEPVVVYDNATQGAKVLFLAETASNASLEANCYAVVDTRAAVAAVVDPGRLSGRRMHQYLESKHVRITHILLTHAHDDHASGLDYLLRHTASQVVLSRAEAQILPILRPVPPATRPADVPDYTTRFVFVPDEASVSCGSLKVQVLLTPGHTFGSQCYYLPDNGLVFTGDTLFRNGIGRTDLPASAGRESLVAYVRAKILVLPDAVQILPGHGSFSTIEREKATNQFLRAPRATGQEQK